MRAKSHSQNTIDYFYWFLLILFTNPGGLQQTLGIFELIGRLNLNDFLFVGMTICYLRTKNKGDKSLRLTKNLKLFVIVFALYYFLVVGYITPVQKDSHIDHLFNFIKLRHAFYAIALFYYSYRFYKRSPKVFLSFFVISGIFILFLFLQSFITGITILIVEEIPRDFIDINRHMLLSYGLMAFLTPLGVAVILFKYRGIYSKHMILGFLLINTAWLISLTRRHIFGLFVTILIGILLFLYINKGYLVKSYISIVRLFLILLVTVILIGSLFPSYIKSGASLINSTLMIIETGKDISGKTDERLAFYGREKMVEEFESSPWLGTGFNNLWRTSEGDRAGYEASDYPFQAALAMSGLLGLLFFLPIYFFLIKALWKDIKFLRKHIKSVQSLNIAFMLAIIINYIFSLLQYMNWFSPVSNATRESGFYIFLGLYFASRELFYENYTYNIN